mmetsp:Transcript_20255/g.42091  ORF Transcript_20255/g.42091 Transcript_20255/m.42091 type:complete len:248 (+) Transcript_20255:200-943(+)
MGNIVHYRRYASLHFIIYAACLFPLCCMGVGPCVGHRLASASVLLSKQSVSMEKRESKTTIQTSLTPKQQEQYQSFRDTINELVTGFVRRPSHRYCQHALYWITATDAVISVILNEYSDFSLPGASIAMLNEKQGVVREVYSKLFYFARMRPRLLYSIGALLRALSLCTPLRYLLDPTAGVGAGIHFFAFLAGSRWVKPLILGWATTKAFWSWLGARPVDRAYVPITLSIHEWEKKAKKNSKIGAGK